MSPFMRQIRDDLNRQMAEIRGQLEQSIMMTAVKKEPGEERRRSSRLGLDDVSYFFGFSDLT